MMQYDIAMFSCEGEQLPGSKTQAMMDVVKAYADFGGRVFLSHFQNIWVSGETNNPTHAPAVWPTIAKCDSLDGNPGNGFIDQTHNPRGASFAQWMTNVQASPTPGVIPITDARQSCTTLDLTKAERWVVFNGNGNVFPRQGRVLRHARRVGLVVERHVPERLLDGAADAAGEGARVHVLRHRELHRPGVLTSALL